jgi:hypothetical protein
MMMITTIPSRCQYKNRPREPPAGRKRRLSGANVLNLPLPTVVLVAKIKFLIYPIHQPGRRRTKSTEPRKLLWVCSISPAPDVWELDGQRKRSDSFPWRLVEQVAPSHVWLPQDPVEGPHSNKRPYQ